MQKLRGAVFLAGLAAVLALVAGPAKAADEPLTLTIKDHKFQPDELRIPSGKRVSVYLVNNDATPEEFDSSDLKIEKVMPGNAKGLIRIGPLTPGRYTFIGEYNAATAKGVVIAE